MINPNAHTDWCDRPEHLASGEEGCRRVVAETEGIAAMLLESGDRIEVTIVNAAGKPMWFWPTACLARVAEAMTAAIEARDRLVSA